MKTRLLTAAVALSSVVLAVALGEVVVRLAGREPWTFHKKDAEEPTMHEPDAVLGWRNKPGKYVVPAYSKKGTDVHLTFLEHGRRLTRARDAGSGREMVLVGGSFTQGWAISDRETFAWKLQRRYRSLNVLNYGTGGYGSYQSLLVLERELPRLASPALVLYGYIQHHELRNIGDDDWLKDLARYSQRGHASVPFVTWDQDRGLVRHAPEHFPTLPLREALATVNLISDGYVKLKARGRNAHQRFVTKQVILEMKKTSESFGAEFVTVLLKADGRAKANYARFFRKHGVRFADCVYPLKPNMRVKGEGHPNGKMHSRWARCIAAEIGAEAALLP